jgi:hypothetical protein
VHSQTKCTATGFAISGAAGERLLLTNAHAVANQVQVQVGGLLAPPPAAILEVHHLLRAWGAPGRCGIRAAQLL